MQLKKFILLSAGNDLDKDTINKAIVLLAQNTGCAVDSEAGEQFITSLIEKEIIDKSQEEVYYENLNIGRWK